MAKSNEKLSLPKAKTVNGVEVKKMPCGKYFEALLTLKDLPEDFITELKKNKTDFKLSEMMTIDGIIGLIMQLLIILPDFTFTFLSKLMGVDEEKMRNELTPKELAEIVQEFWKINELESFFVLMKPIINKIMTLIGFKKQLPSASKLELAKKSF